MTAREWTLDGDEFAAIWQAETGLDEFEFPDPIRVARTPVTRDAESALADRLAARYPAGADSWLTAACRVLARPQHRIRVSGNLIDGSRVRSCGAAVDRFGVVAFQRCPDDAVAGPIQLRVVRADQLPIALAATLPPARAGAAGPMLGYTPRVRGIEAAATHRRDARGRIPVDERIRSLMRLARVAEGQLVIEPDTLTPAPTQYLSWIDIPPEQFAGGRYLIDVNEHETVVTPVDLRGLGHRIAARTGLRPNTAGKARTR